MNKEEKAELRKMAGIGKHDHLKLKATRNWEDFCYNYIAIPWARVRVFFALITGRPVDFRYVPLVRRRRIK